MKFLKVAVLFFGLAAAFAVRAQGGTYPVSGRVIDRLSRRPVAYAAVVLAGQENCIARMVENVDTRKRYSGLCACMRLFMEGEG